MRIKKNLHFWRPNAEESRGLCLLDDSCILHDANRYYTQLHQTKYSDWDYRFPKACQLQVGDVCEWDESGGTTCLSAWIGLEVTKSDSFITFLYANNAPATISLINRNWPKSTKCHSYTVCVQYMYPARNSRPIIDGSLEKKVENSWWYGGVFAVFYFLFC